jgi:hypothetical protein
MIGASVRFTGQWALPGTVVELCAESYAEEQADLESTEAPNLTKLTGMAN